MRPIRSAFMFLAAGCVMILGITSAEARHCRNHRRHHHCQQHGGYGHQDQNNYGYSQFGASHGNAVGLGGSTNVQSSGYSNTLSNGSSASNPHGDLNRQNINSQQNGSTESGAVIQQAGFTQQSQASRANARAAAETQTPPTPAGSSVQQPSVPQPSINEPSVDAPTKTPGL